MKNRLLKFQVQKQAPKTFPNFVPSKALKIGNLLQQSIDSLNSGQLDESEKYSLEVLKISSTQPDALQILGTIAAQKKQFEKAAKLLIEASKTQTNDYFLLNNIGNVLTELGHYQDSEYFFNKVLNLKSDYHQTHFSLGLLYVRLNRLDDALISFDKAITFKHDYLEAYINRGIVLEKLDRSTEALNNYDKAIVLSPNSPEAFANRGISLKKLRRLDDAIKSFDQAIKLQPDYAEAFSNRGVALYEANHQIESLTSFDQALKLRPDYAEAFSNRGVTLIELNELEEAIKSFDQALRNKPDYAGAYLNRGIALQKLKQISEALKSYEKANALNPDLEYLQGTHLHAKMFACDWKKFELSLESLTYKINIENKVTTCFPLLALADDPTTQLKASQLWINNNFPFNASLGQTSKKTTEDRIVIAYYSADFREHPVAYLTAELFELHDKSKFKLIGFYSGPKDTSEINNRICNCFDKFIDVNLIGNMDVAKISRDLKVDIAIDLTGNTSGSRIGIFSYRAAPIQLSYLGYLGTMGAEYYDYLVADKTIIPAENQQYYKEKILYLPSYQVNDSKRVISEKAFTKKDLGLPQQGFIFCCLNSNYKILPSTYFGWMRILLKVPNSILLLYTDNKMAKENLEMQAVIQGVNKKRIYFFEHSNRSEYLSKMRVADLFLDTMPYNAGTTASDALWTGLPVLTCMGQSFASRVAASLLNAIELPELIATSQEQYEALAIELATHPTKLKLIKEKLERNRLTTPLFDTPRFTNYIEAAYIEVYKRYQANLTPEHIYIEA